LENQIDIQEADLRRLRPGTSSQEVPSSPRLHGATSAGRPVRSLPQLPTDVAVREPNHDALATLENLSPPMALHPLGKGEQPDPDLLFSQAFEKLKTGDLTGAANGFQLFVQRFPHHTAADNALLDEGIALYGLRRYSEALGVLARIERSYPAGDAVPEALWRSADCEERMSHPKEVRVLLEHLSEKFPKSPEGLKARTRLVEGPGSAEAEKGVSP
jgi:TolA-binding protein